jgi:hypothetical protein
MVSDRAHLVDFHQRIIFLVKSLVKLQIGMKIAVVLWRGETGTGFSQSKWCEGCGIGVGSTGEVAVSFETVQQVRRFFKIIGGFTLLFVGVVMLITPGPGWLVILGGLAMLAAEFVWARRLLDRLKSQGERLRQTVMPSWISKA